LRIVGEQIGLARDARGYGLTYGQVGEEVVVHILETFYSSNY